MFSSPALPYPPPPDPHLSFQVQGRPSRQKLLHHRRMTSQRSVMQRRFSILRRVAALRQAPPPSFAQVRAPLSVPHSSSGNCVKEKRKTRPAKWWCHKESRFGSWRISDSPSTCVWARPHLSSDASLPPALRCERYEVDFNGRMVPGCGPIMATRRRANTDSLF